MKIKLDYNHQRRFVLRNESGTYEPAGMFNYRTACLLAHDMRLRYNDDTIGVCDSVTGRFVSEILR